MHPDCISYLPHHPLDQQGPDAYQCRGALPMERCDRNLGNCRGGGHWPEAQHTMGFGDSPAVDFIIFVPCLALLCMVFHPYGYLGCAQRCVSQFACAVDPAVLVVSTVGCIPFSTVWLLCDCGLAACGFRTHTSLGTGGRTGYPEMCRQIPRFAVTRRAAGLLVSSRARAQLILLDPVSCRGGAFADSASCVPV